jgi:hypothetical protein
MKPQLLENMEIRSKAYYIKMFINWFLIMSRRRCYKYYGFYNSENLVNLTTFLSLP